MTVDLQQIAVWVTTSSVIVGVFIGAFKIIDKYLFKRFKKIETEVVELGKKYDSLESWTARQQVDIIDGMDESRLLLEGILACLDGLHQQNCNGMVTKSFEKIQEFLNNKAHRASSAGK